MPFKEKKTLVKESFEAIGRMDSDSNSQVASLCCGCAGRIEWFFAARILQGFRGGNDRSMLARKLTTTTPPKSSFIKSFKWCWYLRAILPENVYTCPMRFSSHCCGYKLQFRISGFQDTSDIFDVQRSQELLYVYSQPGSSRLFSIAQCRMPTLSTFSWLNIPRQLPTSPVFPLDLLGLGSR